MWQTLAQRSLAPSSRARKKQILPGRAPSKPVNSSPDDVLTVALRCGPEGQARAVSVTHCQNLTHRPSISVRASSSRSPDRQVTTIE